MGEEVDGRADIYAMGIMAYEMLTGAVPFDSPNVTKILESHVYDKVPDITKQRRNLPKGLVRFVKGSLVKQPEKRLSDWDEIFKLLDTSPPPAAEIWSKEATERVIRIRYVPDAEAPVGDAVDDLTEALEGVAGVQVATGLLRTPEEERSRSKGWFQKLTGY